MRQNGLAARPGVSANQSLDVHRWASGQQFERPQPVHIMHPSFDTHLAFGDVLALAARRFTNQVLFLGGQRAHLVGETLDCRSVAVRSDESRESLHQMPGRAVYTRLITRMEILLWSTVPLLTARNKF